MPALTVKKIPDELYEKLKLSANAHRRSINSELIHCLETILMPKRITPAERIQRARALRRSVGSGGIGSDEIRKAIEQGRS